MDLLALVVTAIAALVFGCLGGFAAAWVMVSALRSDVRVLDADLADLYERMESYQKRAAARARREQPADEDDGAQGSLPGVADPKLKARIRAAWLSRKAV